eukprot:UN33297
MFLSGNGLYEPLFNSQQTIFPRVASLCTITTISALLLCYVWEPLRYTVKHGGKASVYYWLFRDAESVWPILTTCFDFCIGFLQFYCIFTLVEIKGSLRGCIGSYH